MGWSEATRGGIATPRMRRSAWWCSKDCIICLDALVYDRRGLRLIISLCSLAIKFNKNPDFSIPATVKDILSFDDPKYENRIGFGK